MNQKCPSGFIDRIEDSQINYKTLHTTGQEVDSLVQFFCFPWIFRAWTFQELVLSENPVFLCGHNVISWEDMVSAVYQPDMSTELTLALAPWRSLVDIWLGVPRPSRRSALDTDDVEDLSPVPSFGDLVRHDNPENNSLFWTTAYWLCVVFTQLGYWTLYTPLYPLVMFLTGNDREMAFVIFQPFSILFGLPAILFGFGIYFFSKTFLNFVLYGRPQTWLDRSYLPTHSHDDGSNGMEFKTIFVPAIWTTLRERTSSNPLDKAFALSGVLKASGASPSPPDYSRLPKEVFQDMLRDLIGWEPAFLTLIMSGGSKSSQEGWPSWLPDWNAPESNTWLVNRYRDEAHDVYAASSRPFRPAIISGRDMIVQAQFFGTGGRTFHFTTITVKESQNQSELVRSALRQLIMWIHVAFPKQQNQNQTGNVYPYHHRASYTFAVLLGKFPPARAMKYKKWKTTRSKVHRLKEVTVKRAAWAAPYDFTEARDEFTTHCRFLEITNKHYGGAIAEFFREQDSQVGIQETDHAAVDSVNIWTDKIMDELNRHPAVLHYVANVANRLAHERRCLFVMPNGFAGSGPLEMRDGDKVYLVPGVRSPVLLRDQEKKVFSLVGPVLVHGVMRGEGFWEDRLEEVTIR